MARATPGLRGLGGAPRIAVTPGPRGEGGFYAAYFRDPEGNKLNAFVMG